MNEIKRLAGKPNEQDLKFWLEAEHEFKLEESGNRVESATGSFLIDNVARIR